MNVALPPSTIFASDGCFVKVGGLAIRKQRHTDHKTNMFTYVYIRHAAQEFYHNM